MNVQLVSMTKIDEEYLSFLKRSVPEDEFLNNVQDMSGLMAYIARVSSVNDKVSTYEKLLDFCMNHGHWSVFEMIDLTFEIITSRAIGAQILRHRSFNFQEFSQRYAKANLGYEEFEARRQDLKNKQNSIDDMSEKDKTWFLKAQDRVNSFSQGMYKKALAKGIAKEQARALLPLNTKTRMYMKGSLRNWIHYVNLRSGNGTQKEHSEIAKEIGRKISEKFEFIKKIQNWEF